MACLKIPHKGYVFLSILRGLSNAEISRRLDRYCLPIIPEMSLQNLRKELNSRLNAKTKLKSKPMADRDIKRLIKLNTSLLEEIGLDNISGVLLGDRVKLWEDALLLVTDLKLNFKLRTMITLGLSETEMASYLFKEAKAVTKLETIKLAIKLFWDISDLTDLEVYTAIVSISNKKLRAYLLDAIRKNSRRVKWEVLGEKVLSFEDITTIIMHDAFFQYKEMMERNTLGDRLKALKWADEAMKAGEKLSKITSSRDTNAIEELIFDIQKESQNSIPTIGDRDVI